MGAPDAPSEWLLQAQEGLMDDAETADCTVVVQGVGFACHQCVLAAASPFFRATLFTAGMREQAQRRVVLEELTLPVWGVLHRFVYTRQVWEPPLVDSVALGRVQCVSSDERRSPLLQDLTRVFLPATFSSHGFLRLTVWLEN